MSFSFGRALIDPNKTMVMPDYVLVYVPMAKEKTVGGIIIPNSERNSDNVHQMWGLVVRVGISAFPAYRDMGMEDDMPCAGDKVYFERYAANDSLFTKDDPNGEEGRYKILLWKHIIGFEKVGEKQ